MRQFELFYASLSEYSYLGLALLQWIILLLVTCVAWIIARFFLKKATHKFLTITQRTGITWDDMIPKMLEKTHGIFIFLFFLYTCSLFLTASLQARELFQKFLTVATFFQVALWGNEVVNFFLKQYLSKRSSHGDAEINLSAYSAISITARFVLWFVLLLLLLDNLGVDITALVTGLGIGGIAIALAVQNILGDIFASLSIVLDRPFEVGDFIVVDDKAGTVEHIGLKTSRIRSLSGEQLVFPNRKLIETYICNFKRMQTRRIVFSFGVTYSTPAGKLRGIPQLVKSIVESQQYAKFDRAHFLKYGDSALIFEVVYIMQVSDYNTYMDTQQDINFRLLDAFAGQEIEFAFPTRTLIVQTDPSTPQPDKM